MQEIFDAISAARRALDTVEGFAKAYLGVQPPADTEVSSIGLIPHRDTEVVTPSFVPAEGFGLSVHVVDEAVSADAWEVADLSDEVSVLFSGTRSACEAWADTNMRGGFVIRPHTSS